MNPAIHLISSRTRYRSTHDLFAGAPMAKIFEFLVAGVLVLLVLLWPAIGVQHGLEIVARTRREPINLPVKIMLALGSILFMAVGVDVYRHPDAGPDPAAFGGWGREAFVFMTFTWAAALWLPVWIHATEKAKAATKPLSAVDRLYEAASAAAGRPLARGDFGRR